MQMADEAVETVKDCHHPWTWMMVAADGNVKPCCWAPGNLGNLYKDDPDEVWNGKLAQELRQAILDNKIHPICARSPCKYVQNTSAQVYVDAPVSTSLPLKKVIPIVSHELKMTHNDIVAAYKLLLNRLPENNEVIAPRVGRSAENILVEFLLSSEFRRRHNLDQVLLTIASDIVKRRQTDSSNTAS